MGLVGVLQSKGYLFMKNVNDSPVAFLSTKSVIAAK